MFSNMNKVKNELSIYRTKCGSKIGKIHKLFYVHNRLYISLTQLCLLNIKDF